MTFLKLPPPIVEGENPFLHDVLERKKPIVALTNVLENTQNPFVISVNAPWGFGKTFFLQMWKKYLENQDRICLYFNAWETDFSLDPLLSFIGEMDTFVKAGRFKGKDKTQLAKIWKRTKSAGGLILKRGIPVLAQILTSGILSAAEIKELTDNSGELSELVKNLSEDQIKTYSEEKNKISEFKKNLAGLAKVISSESDPAFPLIFMIDELDRCRPTYAIALLERLKHLFNVPGVVFILAIDKEQLKHSIKAVYGIGMDADGYLKRFIDFGYRLPEPSGEAFFEYLIKRFDLSDFFHRDQNLYETAETMIEAFGFSLRSQEQYFTELNFILRSFSRSQRDDQYIAAYLIALKHHDELAFTKLGESIVDVEEYLSVFDTVRARKGEESYYQRVIHIKSLMAAWFILYYSTNKQRNDLIAQYEGANLINLPSDEAEYIKRVFPLIKMIQNRHPQRNQIKTYKRQIELLLF